MAEVSIHGAVAGHQVGDAAGVFGADILALANCGTAVKTSARSLTGAQLDELESWNVDHRRRRMSIVGRKVRAR